MIRTEDITSVSDLRTHLKDRLKQAQETGRPLFITTNGETEAVLLSPAAYDRLAGQAELARSLKQLDASMDDIAAGRSRSVDEAFADSRRKLKERMAAAGIVDAE
ncbi:MAG: type II toxin-antitoxin system Phd/YefM family antitoxin [Phycisphaerae bacterium]